jgi:hypothetical protein
VVTDKADERLERIKQQQSRWCSIVQQWDEMTPYSPIPTFTRAHAEKMIKKLEDEMG